MLYWILLYNEVNHLYVYMYHLSFEPPSYSTLIPPIRVIKEHWANSFAIQQLPTICFTLQYSCLENPMDGEACRAAVLGVAKCRTRLSDFTFTFHFHSLEKEMATHSSVLAWRIPGTGEPGGLLCMGSHRVRHDWSDLAAAAVYICLSQSTNLFLRLLPPLCLHICSLCLHLCYCLEIGSSVSFS